MATNTSIIGIMAVGISFILAACPVKKNCVEATYSFTVKASYIPELGVIKIGDTVYLNSSFNKILKDSNTGKDVDYAGAKSIGTVLYIDELENGNTMPVGSVSQFEFINYRGRIFTDNSVPNSNRVKQVVYEESINLFEVRVALIPKKTGVYSLFIDNGEGNKNVCEKANFTITLSNNNQHLYYYTNWQPAGIRDYEKLRTYCFEVK